MTQTIVINAEKFKSDRERVHWIAELGDIMDDFSRPHASLVRNCNRNQFNDEQLENFHRIQGETRVRRWVVLYKKNSCTIKFDSPRWDSIIHTRLLTGLQDDSITGDIVLYKTSQMSGWPYRTADEHYSGSHHFVTGNVNIPEIYSSNNDLRLDDTHNTLYREYCEEVFPDYRSTSLKLSMSYKLYVLMHMSNSEWVSTFNNSFVEEEHSKMMRAGHLVWTDGQVQRDWIIGGMLHPRFYGDPRF